MPLWHAQAPSSTGMPTAPTHRCGRVRSAALPAEKAEEPAVTCPSASTAQARFLTLTTLTLTLTHLTLTFTHLTLTLTLPNPTHPNPNPHPP